ncbi:MAG TPA: hypothetical protein VGB98_22615 [Pyrinomonadaceae bacterium]|jgi:hypothetical protein
MMAGNSSQEEEIKRYLFRELTPAEAERFEEKLFEDSEYFYDVLGLEDDLVDRYALGKLAGSDLERFERSLRDSPGRREKVAGAVTLQRRISEERRAAAPTRRVAAGIAGASFRERLSTLFSFQAPAFRFAAGGLVIALTFGLVFLGVERSRLGREVALLREGNSPEARRREKELEERITAAQAREAELKRQIESERGKALDLSEQLEGEGAERERLQRELERLRRERGGGAGPPSPAVATVLLLPTGRGAGGAAKVAVGANTARVVLNLELDEAVRPEGLFSVEINGRTVATGLRPQQRASGKQLVMVRVSPRNVRDGVNEVVLKNEGNLPVGDYELRVSKR